MTLPLEFHSIADLGAMYRSGATSPVAAVKACLARIARLDGQVNAFTTVIGTAALKAAHRAAEEIAAGMDRGPLHGIPVALKDLIDMGGVPTGYGSSPVFGTLPARNARLVDRLEAAGAVIIGKTNMLEFAYGAVNPVVGQTNNPWDTHCTAGGSSGGSAAAVAAGMAFAAVGTDTGGSIRIPASYCGIVGLKPSFGSIPMEGVFPLSWTLDHVGPMARTAADALTLFDALTGQRGATEPLPLAGCRMGILRDQADAPFLRPGVRAAFDAAVDILKQAGVTFHDIHIPELEGMVQTVFDILLPEAAIIHKERRLAYPADYAAQTLSQIEAGPAVTAIAHLEALAHRRALTSATEAALNGIDALLTPTCPWVSPAEDPDVVGDAGIEELYWTAPTNLTGLPSVSLFGGTGEGGLPVGIMLTGARGGDRRLMRLAMAVEGVIPPVIAPVMARA